MYRVYCDVRVLKIGTKCSLHQWSFRSNRQNVRYIELKFCVFPIFHTFRVYFLFRAHQILKPKYEKSNMTNME